MLILVYPREEILKRIPPERIREVARYWSFKRDSDWHVYVGNALKEADSTEHLLASIQEFQRALRKDGTNWKALAEKAKALNALKRTQEAITDSSRALEIIPEFQTKAKVEILIILQDSMLDIRDAEGAIEAASKAYDLDPTSGVTIFNKLYTFHKSRKFDKVVEFAKSLTTDFPNDFEGTYLDRMLDEYQSAYEFIGIAAGATNNLDFARDAYLAAAVSAERRRDTDEVARQKYNLGEFYYRHCSDEDKARDLWQYTIRNYGATHAAARSSLCLGTLYYDRAKNAEGERRDPSSWISELERLLEESVEATSASLNDHSLGAGPGSLLGHWYRTHEKRGQAKVTLKPTLKLGIDGLRDQDPSNDSVAYAALGCALLCYGDRENAAIAYAFITPRQKSRELQEIEDHQINNASSNSTIEEAQVPSHKKLSESKQLANIKGDADFTRFELMWGCSGRCQHRMVHWRSIHKCEICDGTFCNECVKLLRNGNLPFRVCDARHPLFKIYPRLEEVRKVDGAFFVKSKGEYISREEWLDMLSEEWLVEELPPHRRPLSPPDQAG
jgi:tetratricopeptide (TPR) repeat protein